MYIYLDIETSGIGDKDEIISISLIFNDTTSYDLALPSRKVKAHAMAIHNITNEMLKLASPIKETPTFKMLTQLNEKNNTLIVHNVHFVEKMLAKIPFVFKGSIIDTKKAVSNFIPECEQTDLQFLRYELKLYRKEQELAQKLGITIFPHHALSDALHIKLLHNYLQEEFSDDMLIVDTTKASLIHRLTFGKYRNRHIEDIARKDPSYLRWILNDLIDIDEDLRYSIEYYLNEVSL